MEKAKRKKQRKWPYLVRQEHAIVEGQCWGLGDFVQEVFVGHRQDVAVHPDNAPRCLKNRSGHQIISTILLAFNNQRIIHCPHGKKGNKHRYKILHCHHLKLRKLGGVYVGLDLVRHMSSMSFWMAGTFKFSESKRKPTALTYSDWAHL